MNAVFRRIAPAFLVVIAATSLLSYIFLLPKDLVGQSKSSLSALLSVSNFYFQQSNNYFDQQSAELPLLHTWSLGVEEQFYLVAPLLICALVRFAPRLAGFGLVLCMVASLACSEWMVRTNPSGAFYLPQSRAWQLLVGVNLNLLPLGMLKQKVLRELVALLGAAGVLLSFIIIRPLDGFPGTAALLPCLATAGLIAAGRDGPTSIGRILSLDTVRFVGLISYSLYLWHWPVIVFAREYLAVANSTRGVIPLSIALSFSLAVLSWRFVERPFRSRRSFISIFRLAAITTGALASMQIAVLVLDGLPFRFPTAALRFADYLGATDDAGANCLYRGRNRKPAYLPENCLRIDTNRSNILLVGDSHAAMFYSALGIVTGTNVLEVAAAACDVTALGHPEVDSDCVSFMRRMLSTRVPWPDVKRIFISSRWPTRDFAGLSRLLQDLQKRAPVVLIGPVPEYEARVPKLLAISMVRKQPQLVSKMLRPGLWDLEKQLTTLSAKLGVQYVSLIQRLCPKIECQVTLDGEPIYLDRDHISLLGARFLLDGLAAVPY